MSKKFTLMGVWLLLCAFSPFVAFADGKSPMEVYIHREMSAHEFTPVTDLFKTDESFAADPSGVFKYVSHAQFFSIEPATLAYIMQAKPGGMVLNIPKADGGVYTINMAQFSFLEDGFKVQTDANGVVTDYNYTPGIYYRGVIDGIDHSIAAFSFFNNKIYGVFSTPDGGNYVLVPNNFSSNSAQSYVLYNEADLKELPKGGCKTDELLNPLKMNTDRTTFDNDKTYNSCKTVKISIRADYESYKDANFNASDLADYLTSTFNSIATLYRNENIYVSLTQVYVNTATDAYQQLNADSKEFLDAFSDATMNNLQGANIAVLVSTKYGSMGGVAWRDGLCKNYNNSYGPYAFGNITFSAQPLPTYSWDVQMLTHEIGHVIGSPHTHSCTWPGGAIDGCYALEGNCSMPSPRYPTGGGTIMSYCHLTNTGINLSKGFGPLPGDLIRKNVKNYSCMTSYDVTNILATKGNVLTANRECTDPNGYTQYWNDANTASQTDDKLVLKVKKNGNDIGTMDSAGFTVRTNTTSGYGTGTGITVAFPSGVQNLRDHNIAMNRYWTLKATKTPANNIEIMFPFTQVDISDVDSLIPGAPARYYHFSMYTVINGGNPSPANNFSGIGASDIDVYSFDATTPSTTAWTMKQSGTIFYARMLSNSSNNGGGAFISYTEPLSVKGTSVAAKALYIYPNPTKGEWTVVMPAGNQASTLQLFGVDGKMRQVQILNSGTNKVDGTSLPTGIYFYRITGSDTYTGTLVKE